MSSNATPPSSFPLRKPFIYCLPPAKWRSALLMILIPTALLVGSLYTYRSVFAAVILEPPVSSIPGSTLTPTASATATRTQVPGNPTATRTTSPGSPSGTPTQIGSNPYPGPSLPAQQTELPSNSPQISETLSFTSVTSGTTTMVFTGTATLIPFPTIALEFPYPAGEVVPTLPSLSRISPGISWFTPTRLLFILFVIFIWVFLGGWYYFSLRRIE